MGDGLLCACSTCIRNSQPSPGMIHLKEERRGPGLLAGALGEHPPHDPAAAARLGWKQRGPGQPISTKVQVGLPTRLHPDEMSETFIES